MLTKIKILILFFVISATPFHTRAMYPGNPVKLFNIRSFDVPEGEFTMPRLSPDGRKIIFTRKDKQGIYLFIPGENENVIELSDEPRAGYSSEWNSAGEKVISVQKSKHKSLFPGIAIHTFNIPGKKEYSIIVEEDSPRLIPAFTGKPHVYFDVRQQHVFFTDGREIIQLTREPSVYYRFVLSPDNNKVVIHRNGSMYIYTVGNYEQPLRVGQGICTSWSPDGRFLLYFIDEDRGEHQIVKSELYIYSIENDKHWQLTDTPDRDEVWPDWKGNTIVYADNKSGKIFIADVEYP
ncbi:MAG: TolB family protein [Bacteroidota bacterium]